jgi:hypothetical protein
MVAMIPLIMYSLFLGDLLNYRLNQDEAVYSTPWDFAAIDYRHSKILPPTQAELDSLDPDQTPPTSMFQWVNKWNQYTYADHSTANNNYGGGRDDLDSLVHHQALASHQCWLTSGAEQITCAMDADADGIGDVDPGFSFLTRGPAGNRHGGGVTRCRARLGVQNYFLPQRFLQSFSKEDMAGETKVGKRFMAGSNVHTNAPSDSYKFPEGVFSVMHDSWALNYVREGSSGDYPGEDQRDPNHVTVDPKNHPDNVGKDEISKWMSIPYNYYRAFTGPAFLFANNGASDFLIRVLPTTDTMGDNPLTPPVAFHPDRDHQFRESYPSGWGDTRSRQMTGTSATNYMRRAPNSW